MRFVFFVLLIVACQVQAFCQKELSGFYGGDLSIRAQNGLIFESQLNNYDFENSGLKNVALIYWPDSEIGTSKTGVTIFENNTQTTNTVGDFNNYADSLVTYKFSDFQRSKFTKITVQPTQLQDYFYSQGTFWPIMSTDSGKAFLSRLEGLGYDGLLLLREEKMVDLIFGTRTRIPSKGVYSYYKTAVVYHGFQSFLLNTKTKKRVKNVGYLQVSGEPLPTEKRVDGSAQDLILAILKIRFQNNIDEFIRVHKLQ